MNKGPQVAYSSSWQPYLYVQSLLVQQFILLVKHLGVQARLKINCMK
ncbi:hypothetical protein F6Y02_06790 (plasmid) [Bacillus megaterium]|nr:hypothetical protein [Priestia megaterium]